LNPWLSLVRRWLDLPPPRVRCEASTEWVGLEDGTRLATLVVRPVSTQVVPASAVLVRSADVVRGASWPALAAQLLAEQGHVVVVQECRGRNDSEGRFRPFADEAADGAGTIEWIAKQPWFEGTLSLVGFGYAGYAAWAALSRATLPVRALVVGFAGRNPYDWLHAGGAFQLESGLAFGVGLGDSVPVAPRALDLARATRFRPVREADRVAHRRTDWFRDWVDHPEPGEFWNDITPPLPDEPPPSLLVGGLHHPALGAQLRDHADLCRLARRNRAPEPELLVGPWAGIRLPRRERPRGAGRLATALGAVVEFLGRRALGASGASAPAPVRVFVRGTQRWRDAAGWPVPAGQTRTWYLRSDGRANDEGGGLSPESPPADEPADHFVYDPADPVPTLGGAAQSSAGPVDQRGVESRGDVLCYTSAPLPEDLVLLGPARVELFAASDAPRTDFTAKLVEVSSDGAAVGLCDGIVRRGGSVEPRGDSGALGFEPGFVERLEIDLWAVSCRVRAGGRLRVEISSSNFPRFDRNPNTWEGPADLAGGIARIARQTVLHDAAHPSSLRLPVLPF
jgi:putative CocE/NonD family hydrolase